MVGWLLTIGGPRPGLRSADPEGRSLQEWLGDAWGVSLSHPKDFTPVCTKEWHMARSQHEFRSSCVKIIGLSVDPSDQRHEQWAKDSEETQGTAPQLTRSSRTRTSAVKAYGMLPATCRATRRSDAATTTRRSATCRHRPDKRSSSSDLSDDDRAQIRRGAR